MVLGGFRSLLVLVLTAFNEGILGPVAVSWTLFQGSGS